MIALLIPALLAFAAAFAVAALVASIRQAAPRVVELRRQLANVTPYTGPTYNRHGREIIKGNLRHV